MASQKSILFFLLFVIFTQMAAGMPSRNNRYPDGQPNREAFAQWKAQRNSDDFERRIQEQEEARRREEARKKELEERNRIESIEERNKENLPPPPSNQQGGH